MANLLSDAKKQQVIALGQLGWTLRRIEAATGVRRETAGAYLKAAGLAVRPPGRWGHPPKPAIEVSTDPVTLEVVPPTPSVWPPRPQRAPAASACEPYRELIELAVARGRNAVAIWRDLVTAAKCGTCHGADLRGMMVGKVIVPTIAGRSPGYIGRALYDFQQAARSGANAVLMKPAVQKLTEDDAIAISAYVASLEP